MQQHFRYDWTTDEVLGLMESALESLLDRAKTLHHLYAEKDVQKCQLLSIKTGGCPEDCGYCSQSVHYETPLTKEAFFPVDKVLDAAKTAKAEGATRFCMGAAWRSIPEGKVFDRLLEMIRGVADLDIEVCVTAGMATESQLKAMKSAGLTSYNHNLDTSREFYPKIISTRNYEDRLDTLKAVRNSGVQICSGGILGMGESRRDRAALLVELATINPHPESVPINLLVPIEGTALQSAKPLPFEEFLRTIAAARILMPKSRVRLSAGRRELTQEQQLQCFEVGANSIFLGEKLLTAPNVSPEKDSRLEDALKLKGQSQPR